ncbi:MAG: hypothetical protein ABR500_08725 [Dermatophilaceae bacterium]|nr:hypothetical protein [Intrasporangiaceae bacterium]
MTSTGGAAVQSAPAPAPPGGAAAGSAGSAPASTTSLVPAQTPGSTDASGQRIPMLGAADVPAALTRWQAALTVAVVVWALVTAALLAASFQNNRAGAANTAQLTRIHDIQSSLFRADAIATNAFLVGGLEPAEQRAAYDAGLEEVSRLITEAADAQSADREALVVLNTHLLRYAEQMQQARANNRQGLPVGAQYLREASAQLRSDTLPVLEALVAANEERATEAFSRHNVLLVALPGVVLLILFGWFNQQLAQSFRRRFNIGLVAAAGVVLALTVVVAAVTWSLASDGSRLQDGDFATAVDTATARTAANDAKSNESLRLIARGSGAAFEEAWVAADARVEELIGADAELSDLWDRYREGHAAIVAADEGGDWDSAVEQAISTGDGSASSVFAAFDERTAAVVESSSDSVTGSLASGGWRAVIAAIATVLAAVAAVAAVAWGLTVRRKEFA